MLRQLAPSRDKNMNGISHLFLIPNFEQYSKVKVLPILTVNIFFLITDQQKWILKMITYKVSIYVN